MTFGLIAVNDSSYVQIDSEKPRLCRVYSGSYSAPSSYTATVVFPAPITTQEPPCIFIRPSTTSSTELYRRLLINGAPGNWTGFSVESSNVTFHPSGLWFAAVFAVVSGSGFGLRIFDAGAALAYDSGAPPVIVTKVSANWTYAGSTTLTLGNAYYWRTPAAAAEGEYLMINPFSRALQAPGSTASTCGIRISYGQGYTEIYALNLNVWTNIGHIPAVFARLAY